ncbi:beta-secretase 2-like [Actinia tenebrosa]|uniref:Beta-secretase 2-like n=1 Tax=Actinia tenebrosa TaxID=6105 RepID=A0A6P8HJE4_ACTTE|nr:beta-secretase 2-like [Actinia tenebrosa]
MVRRWVLCCAYLMFTFVHLLDGQLAGVERAKSTMFSFDIKKKVKHHNHYKGSQNKPLRPPYIKEEEMEFILRSTSYAYVIELDVGSPPQKLEFLIDTGSSNMAIAGPNCEDEYGRKCQIDTFYFPSKSSTAKNLHIPIETQYGKGAWSGNIYRDIVGFPGDGPKTVAEFAVIRNEKDFFLKNSINEGILGLAYRSLATNGVEPLFDQLVQDGKVPNVFTLGLCNGMGQIWLDWPEQETFDGPIHFTEINQETWYSVTMTGIDVAGNSVGLSSRFFPDAIVDSGTTDILLPPIVYAAVINELKKRGPPVDERFWKSYCVDTDPYQWPYITIYLTDMRGGSFGLTILGKHYVRKQDDFHCLSIGLKPSGAVLGEVSMEGNVVIFDRANQRIGFAPSNLTHPEEGPCGNPMRVNNTVTGRLHKYCKATDMPRESCAMSCDPCIKEGGVWCPNGKVVVWINGVRSYLSTTKGFCWQGGLFMLDDAKVQTFLKGHGSAEFQAYCDSLLPMYKQCAVDGVWVVLMAGSLIFLVIMVVLYFCCRRSMLKARQDNYQVNARENDDQRR